MVKPFDGAVGTDVREFALPPAPIGRLCSPNRSHRLIRDQPDESGLDGGSSLSSRARRAAALLSEVPSLR